ncbi:MAG: HD domain-containing protein [Nitrospinota bacterium]
MINNRLRNNFISLPFIGSVKDISEKLQIKIYLVGGIIRDMIMNESLQIALFPANKKQIIDMDFVVTGDALSFGRKVGDAISGSYFPLDEGRAVSRVVIKKQGVRGKGQGEGEEIILDFSKMRGENIEDDLKVRDFTINSIAVNLDDLVSCEEINLIDPTDGVGDMDRKIIRTYDKRVLDNDPLRMLRAVRFESQLGFVMDNSLETFIKGNGYKLRNSSGERIREEFFNILSCNGTYRYIQRLKDLYLLKEIIPEIESMENLEQGRFHKYLLWDHSLNTLRNLEMLMENLYRIFPDRYLQIGDILSGELEHGINCRGILKLAALIHDTGKVQTRITDENGEVRFINHENISADNGERLAQRLKLGSRACRIMGSIIKNHMRPLLLSREKKVTNRAILRFFTECRKAGVLICLLSMADIHATMGSGIFDDLSGDIEGFVKRMLEFYFEDFIKIIDSPLISGDEIIERLGLKAGPEIGEILKNIEEWRAEGIISHKDEAINYLKFHRNLYHNFICH